MAEERKLCTGRGSRKKGGGGRFASSVETFPCGALAEHGVEHCTVHLTDQEKRFLQHRRDEVTRWQNTEHKFMPSEGDSSFCCLCKLAECVHGR